MIETKRFHIGDVLSITTGRLVSRDHMDGIYAILNHMTGENLYTHQLGRAMRESKPYVLDQFPELRDAEPPEEFDGKDAVMEWVGEQVGRYGEWFDVRPIPVVARMPHDLWQDLEDLMAERPQNRAGGTE